MDHNQTYQVLPEADQQLLDVAAECLDLAYAPYSKFRVGAALRTGNGHIVKGANQENASYPLCICGERVALFNKAVSFPEESVTSLAIRVSGSKPINRPAPPCGACLQVISEFERRQNGPIRILLQGDTDEVLFFTSVKDLLPIQFDGSFLKDLS
jgi:cytidine deaminase